MGLQRDLQGHSWTSDHFHNAKGAQSLQPVCWYYGHGWGICQCFHCGPPNFQKASKTLKLPNAAFELEATIGTFNGNKWHAGLQLVISVQNHNYLKAQTHLEDPYLLVNIGAWTVTGGFVSWSYICHIPPLHTSEVRCFGRPPWQNPFFRHRTTAFKERVTGETQN